MGTINYGTSEYITMGIKPYDADDIARDADFIEWCNENGYTDADDIYNLAYDELNNYYDCDRANFECALNNYNFEFFAPSIVPGYYEGLYVELNPNFDFYNYDDKRRAQKEVTQLKKFLFYIAGCGFVACFPFWVTSYRDYNGTLQEINDAIKEMRADIKKADTDYLTRFYLGFMCFDFPVFV